MDDRTSPTRRPARVPHALAASALALLAAACAQGVEVSTTSSPTPSFAPYHTFALGPALALPTGYDTNARAVASASEAQPLVVAQLRSKGYELAVDGQKPDFVMRIGCGEKVITHPTRRERGTGETEIDPDTSYRTCVFDAYDANGGDQRWHGQGTSEIDPKSGTAPTTERAVAEVLEKFPRAVSR